MVQSIPEVQAHPSTWIADVHSASAVALPQANSSLAAAAAYVEVASSAVAYEALAVVAEFPAVAESVQSRASQTRRQAYSVAVVLSKAGDEAEP